MGGSSGTGFRLTGPRICIELPRRASTFHHLPQEKPLGWRVLDSGGGEWVRPDQRSGCPGAVGRDVDLCGRGYENEILQDWSLTVGFAAAGS